MKRSRSKAAILVLGFAFGLLALPGVPWEVVQGRLEGAMIDWLFKKRGAIPPREDIVVLGIDSESMEFFEDELEAYPDLELLTEWPWPREVHGMLLDRLVEAGARVVAFDILFLGPSIYGEEDDARFREALLRHRERVVIGFSFEDTDATLGRTELNRPSATLFPEEDWTDFAGFVRYPKDFDGRVRRAFFETTPALVSGIRAEPLAEEPKLVSFPAMAARKFEPQVVIPGWRETRMIRYAGPSRTFPQFPVSHVFHDRYWDWNFRRGEFFRDKVVLIGATAGFMHDVHMTPMGSMAGVEIHANSVAMLLDQTFLREPPLWFKRGLTLLAGMAGTGLILLWRGAHWVKFAGMIVAGAGAVAGTYGLFVGFGLVVAFPHPYLAFFGAGVSGLAIQLTVEQMEKRRLSRTFGTFVSSDVARYLIAHPEEYERVAVGRRKHCVILFSDIRGFTTLTEEAEDPEAFVSQLNEYLAAWVDCVFDHGGTLDKFVGDAVMAVWGGIQTRGEAEDARCAVRASLAMREKLEMLNRRWEEEGKPVFRIGVGIGAGEAMVGNMGSPGRKLEFTVIGDPVNLAARLEGETKAFGEQILVSEEVQRLIAGEVRTRSLGEIQVRGRKKGVRIHAVEGLHSPEPTMDRPDASVVG